jgi:integrase
MQRRRGNGEGSIYRRQDGRWAAAFSTGDGRCKTVYGRTRAEVANKLSEAQRAHHDGVLPADGRLTVSAFAKEWLEGVPDQRKEEKAWETQNK